jgi:nucleotide-binding universal stress UspA family protein
MFKRILVPLDGSALAESVVPHAIRLPRAPGADVVLLRALPAVGIPRFDDKPILEEMEKQAEEYLGRIDTKLEGMGIPTQWIVREGDPAEVILDICDELKVDLIAMSTRARSDLGRWVFGSVAERIQRHARVPLLLVRGEEEAPADWEGAGEFKRILLPLDGSALAEAAVPFATKIGKACDGTITVLQAVVIPPLPGLEPTSLVAEAVERVQEYLDGVLPKLDGRGVARVVEGIPADMILAMAEKEKTDLVVMTTHGRGGLRRFMMGSVANRVIRGLGGPVLLIRSTEGGS